MAFFKWLFCDKDDGHAALALLCLAACVIGARLGVADAADGVRICGAMFLLKLKT